ncbi:endonuclease/exonuclease/phosphatase family protein [Streptomyces sp. GC420]|uniref:endonuclease/exonuclease/phosphatase family protein n=1 Tax=Streptomyces sp. GC420 TaxID=2697568 RepID=UPI0028BEE91B|nr:endonuclease/exonuclease/phosphatase family protein [Streptomyces sp. GC420]
MDAAGRTPRPLWRRLATWVAGPVLAGLTAVVGCRAAGVDGITPVPQLLAFLPWLLLPGAVALVVAGLARWRVGLLWSVVVLAVTCWFLQPYDATADVVGSRGHALDSFRVLTANVEFGNATEALIDTLEREKPDLVFVEECDHRCSSALAEELPRSVYPYRNVAEGFSAEGSAILSTFPLESTEGVEGRLAMPGARAAIGGRSVAVQLAHPLPPIPGGIGDWRTELGRLRDYAGTEQSRGRPLILAGDFNASQDHAAFRAILGSGKLRDSAQLDGRSRTPSWPAATAPPLGAQIDHILVSRDFDADRVRFLDLPNTDHRAVLVDLTLYGAGQS